MTTSTVQWQAGDSHPDNGTALTIIQNWWHRLQGQTVLWQQRLLDAANPTAETLNWELQRFDETLTLDMPALRGVTLFWQKAGDAQERNLTAQRLVFDPQEQKLDIYTQAQANLVVRVSVPQPQLTIVALVTSNIRYQVQDGQASLVVQDLTQGMEAQIQLSPEQAAQLKAQL